MARILLILPFVALAVRAAYLSVDQRGSDRGQAQSQTTLHLAPERGVIYDRNGVELALSIDAPSIYANPSAIHDVPGTAKKLAQALGRKRDAIAPRLSGSRSFAFVSRWVTVAQAAEIEALELDGVGVVLEPRRIYPHGTMAAPVLGFANIDGHGVRGIEQQMDDWLRGTALRLPVERDARGRLLVDVGRERWSTTGGDIALTLDAAFQADAEGALTSAVEATGARGGVAISLDPRTGDILALAEAPGFDPNRFREYNYHSTRSRSFLDSSDPGSTMKSFLIAAAIENAAVTPEDRFDCENGEYQVPGSIIHDSHPYGILTVAEILQKSSNIGATKVAFKLGARAYAESLELFGFGQSSGNGFPGESAGLLRPWQKWRAIDHANIAFGQGLNATPIQLAAATAALANGGEWVQPRLVAARRVTQGRWQPARIEPRHRAVSAETAAEVVEMMELVVGPGGTAKRASLRGVRVAGKTGTAQKFDRETGKYATDRFVAWFIGIVPADDPKFVIVVAIDEPKRPFHTGGAAAAPVFAHMASSQLARYGIVTEPGVFAPRTSPSGPVEPAILATGPTEAIDAAVIDGTETAPRIAVPATAAADVAAAPPAHRAATPIPTAPAKQQAVAPRATIAAAPSARGKPPRSRGRTPSRSPVQLVQLDDRVLLPDFRGLTRSEVSQITAKTPLGVKMSGHGRAVNQVPPAGTILAAEQALVVIYFEDFDRADRAGES